MESCIVPKDIVRKRLQNQRNDSRASRLSFNITRQNSSFQGNVSLIKVNCKTVNRITNILPLENDTLGSVKERLLYFIEKAHGYVLTDIIKESFNFQLGENSVRKEDENLPLEETIKKCCEKSYQFFEGDVLNISFLITDLDMEYQMIKDNLDKFKGPSTSTIHLVKQRSQRKGKMKNRLLKIEENEDDCLISLYNIRGDLKETYPIQALNTKTNDQVKIFNINYFPLSLLKSYEGSGEEQRDSSEELIYFTDETDLTGFLETLNSIKDQQVDSDEDLCEGDLEESIRELGTDETEDLDEGVEVGQIHKLEAETPRKGNTLRGPMFRAPSANVIETKANNYQVKSKRGLLVGFSSVQALPKVIENPNGSDEECEVRKTEPNYIKSELIHKSSAIGKAMTEKRELDLEAQEFEVKVKSLWGIYSKRLLRLTDDFELHFFKKEKEKYLFVFSVPISSLTKAQPKKGNSFKVYFYLKTDKKQQKPIKVAFNNQGDLKRFFQLSKRIAHLFNSSANSFQTEKERNGGEKLYPWLMGPKDSLANVQYEQGKITTMQFNVINLSHSQEPQVAHLDLITSTLTLKSVVGVNKKKLNIRNIIYCGTNFRDMRALTLILKNNKYKLLFSDNRSRICFESAIYNAILPQYRIPSKKPFEWENLRVFSTTFNAGFGAPPEDLSPWLGKTLDCDLIAIGMQEADTAEWVQALQLYYSSDKFTLVTLVTMWKMLLCVFVSSKYSNYITNVEVDSKATGIAKVIGNKGGVAVSFRLLESSFCFLSCHLAAQPERMPTRKANFYNLLKSIRLGDESLEAYSMHDYFFFMGDTNFRLDYDFFKAVETINEGEHVSMLPHDQYKKAREEDNFMTLFIEGKITFKPTYRRNREDTGYSNKRNQAPSWTDRIFIKSRPAHPVTICDYNSAEMFFLSDHRPVYGIYKCEVQPPYLPRTPLYSRPSGQEGVIKIKELELEYDFELYGKMGDFESQLVFPSLMSIGFRSTCLQKGAVTMPMELKIMPSNSVAWNEEMLPLLYTTAPDYRYLKSANLLALVKISEMVIGQADISLEDLMLNQGRKTEFKTCVYFYGRRFGSVKGVLIYDFN